MPVPVEKTIMKEKKEDNPDEGSSYQLNVSDNATFINRVDSIFGSLTSLEEKHTEAVRNYEVLAVEEKSGEVVDDVDDGQGCSSSGNCDTGNEKEPVVDLRNKLNKERNKRRAPDFVSNPSKWKKYSLEEDGTAQFSKNLSSDQLNSAVALDFMKQLKKTKDSSEEEMETDQKPSESFVFKVPDLPNKSYDSSETTAVCKSTGSAGARMMETFQFGQKSTAKKPKVKHIDDNSSEEKKSDIVSLDLHPCVEEDENVEDFNNDSKKHEEKEVVAVFVSRGNKKNRCIRKKTCEDEDDE